MVSKVYCYCIPYKIHATSTKKSSSEHLPRVLHINLEYMNDCRQPLLSSKGQLCTQKAHNIIVHVYVGTSDKHGQQKHTIRDPYGLQPIQGIQKQYFTNFDGFFTLKSCLDTIISRLGDFYINR